MSSTVLHHKALSSVGGFKLDDFETQQLLSYKFHHSLNQKGYAKGKFINENIYHLLLNKNSSLFVSDHLLRYWLNNKPALKRLIFRKEEELSPKFNANHRFHAQIRKDRHQNSISYKESLTQEVYQEPLPNFNWKVLKQERIIKGFLCRKASVKYAGREFIAWFSSELPYKDGPYKFNGLPGVIMLIHDIQFDFYFEVQTLKACNFTLKKEKD